MNREIVRRLWEIVGGNSLMNVGLDTIFYVGQLIWAGFLTLRWIDGLMMVKQHILGPHAPKRKPLRYK